MSQVASFAIRVFEYGCGPGALTGLERAIEQMRRRNVFWNQVVEIDNDIRTRMDALLFAGAKETALNLLRDRLKQLLRNRAGPSVPDRSANWGDDQISTEISALRASIRVTLAEVKPIRKENAARNRSPLGNSTRNARPVLRRPRPRPPCTGQIVTRYDATMKQLGRAQSEKDDDCDRSSGTKQAASASISSGAFESRTH